LSPVEEIPILQVFSCTSFSYTFFVLTGSATSVLNFDCHVTDPDLINDSFIFAMSTTNVWPLFSRTLSVLDDIDWSYRRCIWCR